MAKLDLYDEFLATYAHDSLHDNREYVSRDVMERMVTRDNVKNELGKGRSRIIRAFHRHSTERGLADNVMRNGTKLFIILLHLGLPRHIREFLQAGLTDDDLPLLKKGMRLESVKNDQKGISPPNSWNAQRVRDFCQKQWLVLAPTFSREGRHSVFSVELPLPFSEVERKAGSQTSTVSKAQIHRFHQQNLDAELSNFSVALKEFTVEKDFQQERQNLNRIRELGSTRHITLQLETFSQGGRYYIIFPWAEGGNLDTFWEDNDDKRDRPGLALWCLDQMLGLSEALRALHNELEDQANCRHGDLKPENILYFPQWQGAAILKLTDFGISRIHNDATYERPGAPTTTRATTPSYEAPEALEAISKRGARSRKYDIWSLGCIFLEFAIWLVDGWKSVNSFGDVRRARSPALEFQIWSPFYLVTREAEGRSVQVHPEVVQKIADLKRNPQSKNGTALGDLLDLIEARLIKINVEERFDAGKVYEQLDKIVTKAKSDSSYLSNSEQ